MNLAFEVTVNDVLVVMANNNHPISEEDAEVLFDEYILSNADEIEKAALYGNELEEQTDYAYDKITEILVRAGVIPRA